MSFNAACSFVFFIFAKKKDTFVIVDHNNLEYSFHLWTAPHACNPAGSILRIRWASCLIFMAFVQLSVATARLHLVMAKVIKVAKWLKF